jgi:glycosyltransferase involved in cell wall biosynthesis
MKVAVVTAIPTPYRDAFWNHFSQQTHTCLHVIYCSKGKADRPWKSNWEKQFTVSFLKGINLLSWLSRESSMFFNPGILSTLNKSQPDVILIGGYNHLTMWMAMAWAFLKRTPFLLMSETKGLRPAREKDPFFKATLLKWLAKHSSGALPTGLLAEDYLLKNGWDKQSLFRLPNVPDIVSLNSKVIQLKQQKTDLLKKWDLNGEKLVLYVGRLIEKKHVDTIIQAFSKVHVSFPIKLIIVGDGDQSQRLKEQCRQLKIMDQVRFLGFLEPAEILEWLALADVFALASNETWGVAPIEAAAAGTRLLLSCEVGSANEIQQMHSATKVFSTRKVDKWSQAMEEYLSGKINAVVEIADHAGIRRWHFDELSHGLFRHLKELIRLKQLS